MSLLRNKALYIVMSFLLLLSTVWSFSFVDFKNVPEYLTRWIAQVFILLMKFLLYSLVSSSYLVLRIYSFVIFFIHFRLFDGVRFQYFQIHVSCFFSERSDFFLIW